MVVTVTDDMDGSEGAETVTFGLDGQSYEIDLNHKNQAKLKKGLQPFIDSGRRLARSSAARPAHSKAPKRDSAAIRAWAAEQGLPVSERGRIPATVLAKYEAAH